MSSVPKRKKRIAGAELLLARKARALPAVADGHTDTSGDGTVVVGTYDGGLLGFRLSDGEPAFGYTPHIGCVKALHCDAHSGRLASGGTDNAVRLFDLAKGIELGDLHEHQDSVCQVEFCGTAGRATNLVTGGVDGKICIWRCSDWELLRKFRGHKAVVTSLAVHPSGRLMASAGGDSTLRLWDLTRATAAVNMAVSGVLEGLVWCPDQDDLMAALCPEELQVVNAQTGMVASFKEPPANDCLRVTSTAVMFATASLLILGSSKGDLRLLQLSADGSELAQVGLLPDVGKRGRIKTLVRCTGDVPGSLTFLAGVSSGVVEVWSTKDLSGTPASFTRRRAVDTHVRLTCLAFWRGLRETKPPSD